jgi:hypothetical protein
MNIDYRHPLSPKPYRSSFLVLGERLGSPEASTLLMHSSRSRVAAATTMLIACVSIAVAQTFGLPIKWSTYRSGSDSLIGQDTTQVINNEAEWQKFWTQLTGSAPSSAPRDIKWGAEMAVVVNLAHRPLGTSVLLESVDRTSPADVQVKYAEQLPPAGFTSSVKLNTYQVIRMDRPGGSIRFAKDTLQNPVQVGTYGNNGYVQQSYNPSGCWWSTYAFDTTCGVNDPSNFLITSQSAFDQYWSRLGEAGPAPADVDWTHEILAAIHLGRRNTTGYDVILDSVNTLPDGSVLVSYAEKTPSPGQHVKAATSSPYLILKLARTSAGATFQKRIWNGSSSG